MILKAKYYENPKYLKQFLFTVRKKALTFVLIPIKFVFFASLFGCGGGGGGENSDDVVEIQEISTSSTSDISFASETNASPTETSTSTQLELEDYFPKMLDGDFLYSIEDSYEFKIKNELTYVISQNALDDEIPLIYFYRDGAVWMDLETGSDCEVFPKAALWLDVQSLLENSTKTITLSATCENESESNSVKGLLIFSTEQLSTCGDSEGPLGIFENCVRLSYGSDVGDDFEDSTFSFYLARDVGIVGWGLSNESYGVNKVEYVLGGTIGGRDIVGLVREARETIVQE